MTTDKHAIVEVVSTVVLQLKDSVFKTPPPTHTPIHLIRAICLSSFHQWTSRLGDTVDACL